jgi:hypothetical protein
MRESKTLHPAASSSQSDRRRRPAIELPIDAECLPDHHGGSFALVGVAGGNDCTQIVIEENQTTLDGRCQGLTTWKDEPSKLLPLFAQRPSSLICVRRGPLPAFHREPTYSSPARVSSSGVRCCPRQRLSPTVPMSRPRLSSAPVIRCDGKRISDVLKSSVSAIIFHPPAPLV